jgi:hypothetical protein
MREDWPNLTHSAWICTASSRVGASTSTIGPSPGAAGARVSDAQARHAECAAHRTKEGLRVDVHDGGQQIRKRLARTRLGDADEVAPEQRHGPPLRLNGRGFLEASAFHLIKNIAWKRRLVEAGARLRHVVSFDRDLLLLWCSRACRVSVRSRDASDALAQRHPCWHHAPADSGLLPPTTSPSRPGALRRRTSRTLRAGSGRIAARAQSASDSCVRSAPAPRATPTWQVVEALLVQHHGVKVAARAAAVSAAAIATAIATSKSAVAGRPASGRHAPTAVRAIAAVRHSGDASAHS